MKFLQALASAADFSLAAQLKPSGESRALCRGDIDAAAESCATLWKPTFNRL